MTSPTSPQSLALRPMSSAEYEAYRAFIAVDDSPDREARQGTDKLLPQGLLTEGHQLFSLIADAAHVGVLWMTTLVRPAGPEAYIMDLVVFAPYRRCGYARLALPLAEDIAREAGLRRISLSVTASNAAAAALYRSAGFEPVFTRLTKTLESVGRGEGPLAP